MAVNENYNTKSGNGNNAQSAAIVFTEEELDAMRQVKKRLEVENGLGAEGWNLRFLAFTVIVCKNRVDEATEKYRKFLKAIASCGMTHIETEDLLWGDPDVEQHVRDFYVPCGTDSEGHQIFWIRGQRPVAKKEEIASIRAGVLYVIAIHADSASLREGITFVIDTSENGTFKKEGNEAKLQRINQSWPLRPQAIYLAGASVAMRIVINGLIRIASLFTKQKILDRIKFVSLEDAMRFVPKESGPKYLGGDGGGIDDVYEWTKKRYYAMPVPEL